MPWTLDEPHDPWNPADRRWATEEELTRRGYPPETTTTAPRAKRAACQSKTATASLGGTRTMKPISDSISPEKSGETFHCPQCDEDHPIAEGVDMNASAPFKMPVNLWCRRCAENYEPGDE